jgi:hypothetical protein
MLSITPPRESDYCFYSRLVWSARRVMPYPCLPKFPLQMDSKVPIETFEKVLELATKGVKAIATFMREVSSSRFAFLVYLCFSWRR